MSVMNEKMLLLLLLLSTVRTYETSVHDIIIDEDAHVWEDWTRHVRDSNHSPHRLTSPLGPSGMGPSLSQHCLVKRWWWRWTVRISIHKGCLCAAFTLLLHPRSPDPSIATSNTHTHTRIIHRTHSYTFYAGNQSCWCVSYSSSKIHRLLAARLRESDIQNWHVLLHFISSTCTTQ